MITSKMMSKKMNQKEIIPSSLAMLRNSGANQDPINRTVNGPEQTHLIPWGEVRVRKEMRIHSSSLFRITTLKATPQPWPSRKPPGRTWGPRDR